MIQASVYKVICAGCKIGPIVFTSVVKLLPLLCSLCPPVWIFAIGSWFELSLGFRAGLISPGPVSNPLVSMHLHKSLYLSFFSAHSGKVSQLHGTSAQMCRGTNELYTFQSTLTQHF